MGEEKRKRERFPLAQNVELITSEGTVVNSNGVNISEGGILCRTEKDIATGTTVTFQLTIPIGKRNVTVSCEGVILRCLKNNDRFDVAIVLTDQEYA